MRTTESVNPLNRWVELSTRGGLIIAFAFVHPREGVTLCVARALRIGDDGRVIDASPPVPDAPDFGVFIGPGRFAPEDLRVLSAGEVEDLALPPNPWSALEAEADAAEERGDLAAAESARREAVKRSMRVPHLVANLATFLWRHARRDEAFPLYLEAEESQRRLVGMLCASAADPDAEPDANLSAEILLHHALVVRVCDHHIACGEIATARERLAPILVGSPESERARESWADATDALNDAATPDHDPGSIWHRIIALELRPFAHVKLEIEARFVRGRWQYRRGWPPMWEGAIRVYDRPTDELRSAAPTYLEPWRMVGASPLALSLFDEAASSASEGAETPVNERVRAAGPRHVREKAFIYGEAWMTLIAVIDRLNDEPPSERTEEREFLDALSSMSVFERVDGGNPNGTRASSDRYETELCRARLTACDELPLEDLDLAAGALSPLFFADPGAADALLNRALPRYRALQPWARDLTLPAGESQRVLTARFDGRTVSLVRDTRRWGVAIGIAEPIALPPGVGFELLQGSRAAGEAPRDRLAGGGMLEDATPGGAVRSFAECEHRRAGVIGEALLAHAEAVRYGADPREPRVVLSNDDGELLMLWTLGRWWYRFVRLAHRGKRLKRHKVSPWRTDLASFVFPDDACGAVPDYVHPIVAMPLARAYAEAVVHDAETDGAWCEMIDHLQRGLVWNVG